MSWYVYLVRCSDGSLYCGVTTDLKRRVHEHNHTRKGAKYTSTRRPVKLVWSEPHPSRSSACQKEHAIKRLPKAEKERLVSLYKIDQP